MKNFKKFISLSLMTTLVLTSLAGCGSKTNSSSGEKKAGSKIELSFMDWESPEMNTKMMEAIKEFETENPGVTVKQIPTPMGDYGLKLNQMIAAKAAPDIFQAGHDMAIQMSGKGKTYDFSKEAKADEAFTKEFYPGVYELWVKDGKVMGLPGLLNAYGVFYNKDIFKKAGIEEPKIGWTWQTLFEDAQKLSSKSNGVKNYGIYNLTMDAFRVSVMSVSNGGEPFTDQIKQPTKVMADEKFKTTVQTLQGYIKNGAIAPPSYKNDNLSAAFMQGKIPMMEFGQWIADDLIRNAPKDFKWGFAPTPKGDSKQSTVFDCVGWASPKDIKNPEMVWKLMKFMDSKMYEKVLAATPVAPTAYMPSAQPYYDKLKESGHQDVSDSLDYMFKTEDKQPVRFNTLWSGDAGKYMIDWNNVLEGKKEISYIDKMVQDINKVIEDNK